MSNYQSSSSLYSAASPVVGCDAWANIRVGNGSTTDQLRASSGIQGVTYISSGVHGISFSVPTRLGGGGYVILFTPEVKDHTVPVVVQSTRNLATANIGATAPGTTAGVRYTTYKFPGPVGAGGNTATIGDFNVGGGNDDGVHLNTAVFGFKTTRDLYDPYVANLIQYSEDLTQWGNVKSGTGLNPVVESNVEPNPVTGELNADKVTLNIGATSANSGDFSILQRDISFNSVFKGVTGPNGLYTWSFWAKSAGGGSTLSIRGPAGSAYTHITLTSNWKRYSGTEQIADNAVSAMQGVAFTLRGNFASGLNASTVSAYIWGVQVEPGSLASPYVKTEATYPVFGNQDAKKQLFPGASGFGVTGATYNSHMPSLLSARSPVAYGTVVIPPNTGTSSPVSAYIEGGYNVLSGVSAGANSVFDITFAKPLVNANYCVILSGEVESSVVDYGNLTDYSMLLVGRGYKTVNGFRVISLKQNSTDNSWVRSSVTYQSGVKERIHFMVFGGGTYGQP